MLQFAECSFFLENGCYFLLGKMPACPAGRHFTSFETKLNGPAFKGIVKENARKIQTNTTLKVFDFKVSTHEKYNNLPLFICLLNQSLFTEERR